MDRQWNQIYEELAAADSRAPLDPAEVERWAVAAYLTGHDAESADLFGRAHKFYLDRTDVPRAVRCAFWVGFVFATRGELGRASGWHQRARRLLDEAGRDCVEQGYLLVPEALQQIGKRDFIAAEATLARAASIGERFGDADLVNLARQGRGRVLIALGAVAEGVAILDEVMLAATAGELSPLITGTIYCSVVSACFEMWDVQRAREWTEALNQWCLTQRDTVPYRGECLVHRAEILRLQGVWGDALEQARAACDLLSQPSRQPALGAAFYQLGEIHRVRGEFDAADKAYRLAAEAGRTPQPGLALLRLMEGRVEAAQAAVSRVLEEARDGRMRCPALAAAVDIAIAAGDMPAAARAAAELSQIASDVGTPLLRAAAAHAAGAVSLAAGDARKAIPQLREACMWWRQLEAPYEGARTAALLGNACLALGDVEGARLEHDAARGVFRRLGATVDLSQLEAGAAVSTAHSGPLTDRERQVLKLIATGQTNRAIADSLQISEKTVARHVSNIFTKLDLSTRAAAAAYAFRHGLA